MGNSIKNITRSGTTFTATKNNGGTFTFNQQDNDTNTVYTVAKTNLDSMGRSRGSSVNITATAVSGYTFVSWLGASTSGWIASVYIEEFLNSTTKIWVGASNYTDGNGAIRAWALYKK